MTGRSPQRPGSTSARAEVAALDRPFIREELADRVGYLRLDKNENLEPLPEPMLEELRRSLMQEAISPYPDLSRIYRKVAAMAGVAEDMILLGAGSDAVLKAIYDTFVMPGDEIVLHAPSYFMYEIYAVQAGAKAVNVPIGEDWAIKLDSMLAAVTARTRMVIVESPSGFTGSSVAAADLRSLAQRLAEAGVLLVIDEAYLYVEADRSENEALLPLGNVIISRTLSKAHGLAGARVGFLIAHSARVRLLAATRPLYELSALGAWVAEWCLDRPELLSAYRSAVRKGKAAIGRRAAELGIAYRETPANFFLMRIRGVATPHLVELFRQRGFLVRRPFDESILSGWVRVTVPPAAELDNFLTALSEIRSDFPQLLTA